MSASEDSAGLWADYLSECDEHLSAARQALLDWSTSAGNVLDRNQLDSLFRNFHTLKGLSGIAGVPAAEQLAHLLETYLSAVRKGQTELGPAGASLLLEGAASIESAIARHKTGAPPPDASALAARIDALLAGESEPVRQPAPKPAAAGPVWRVEFVPSPDLAARGVTVNTVRDRLKAAGTILRAAPSPLPAGGIRFTFFLTGPADASAFAGWATDGLSVERDVVPEQTATASVMRALAPANLVRVDLARLDDLMQTVGELVLSRARLENQLNRASALLSNQFRRELEETGQIMARQLRHLREGVMRARLVPVRDVFARMRLVARDTAKDAGKDVDLVLTGEKTEVDKFVVERMADPLLHLIRNAVSHGLETATERASAGKSPRGRVDLRSAAAGGTITVQVEDDGRGIDAEAVFARAGKLGLLAPDARPDPALVLDLLCTPGFSTREVADRTSGRGVGMDVVRRGVEELGGFLELVTRPGKGTRFTLRLPVTLAIADVVTVAVGDQTYAVPQTVVREIVEVNPTAITVLENNELVENHGGVLPLFRLGDLFGVPRPPGVFTALIVGEGAGAIALGVDRAIGLREVVVRPLADPFVQATGVSGATELGDGRAVLLLDVPGLARYARGRRRPSASGTGA